MRNEKSLTRLMQGLVNLLAEESARNPEFSAKLDLLLSDLPQQIVKTKKVTANKSTEQIPDNYYQVRDQGGVDFHLWLKDQDITSLRAIIRKEDIDPTRRTSKWKDTLKLVNYIVEALNSRQSRGHSFTNRE
jgi:hypothetical protein